MLHQRFVQKVQESQSITPHYSQRKECVACTSPENRWARIVKPNHLQAFAPPKRDQ